MTGGRAITIFPIIRFPFAHLMRKYRWVFLFKGSDPHGPRLDHKETLMSMVRASNIVEPGAAPVGSEAPARRIARFHALTANAARTGMRRLS